MKRVKLQPRQHTIVCNDEELDCVLDAIEFYVTRTETIRLKNTRDSYFNGANPYLNIFDNVITELNNITKRDVRISDCNEWDM